jgi:hypothetical protein
MAILVRQFYAHEKGNHDETFYSLARDSETGRVFIIHEWFARENVGSSEMTVAEFYAQTHNSSAWSRFVDLVGTLATEPSHANRT